MTNLRQARAALLKAEEAVARADREIDRIDTRIATLARWRKMAANPERLRFAETADAREQLLLRRREDLYTRRTEFTAARDAAQTARDEALTLWTKSQARTRAMADLLQAIDTADRLERERRRERTLNDECGAASAMAT
ncbi:MAG: hypothetical protein AAF205_13195 [Pseudomonadota bacterium]